MIFRCKISGNTVEFTAEHDVKDMLKHPQYEVVEPKVVEVKEEKPKAKKD